MTENEQKEPDREESQDREASGKEAEGPMAPLGVLFLAAAVALALLLTFIAIVAFIAMSRHPRELAPASSDAGAGYSMACHGSGKQPLSSAHAFLRGTLIESLSSTSSRIKSFAIPG